MEPARIGRSLLIKGEVSGSESVHIEGRIEGTIDFSGQNVTIGATADVAANIIARDVLILGKVRGNIQCSDRVQISSEGSVSGDVTTRRISVEDGAILEGSVQIRAVEAKPNGSQTAPSQSPLPQPPQPEPPSAEAEKPAAVPQPVAASAAVGSSAPLHSVRSTSGPSFADRARSLIKGGYKPKDAVELVLQDTALESHNNPRVMEKSRADAEDFLQRIRKGLI
jgi:cytoskeletal protein CcmA (bactofilin family)